MASFSLSSAARGAQVLFRASGTQAMVPPTQLIERIRRAVAANQEVGDPRCKPS